MLLFGLRELGAKLGCQEELFAQAWRTSGKSANQFFLGQRVEGAAWLWPS